MALESAILSMRMPSVVPWIGGGQRQEGTGWDIFPSLSELWEPFGFGGGLTSGRSGGDQVDEVTAIVHANVDWRETDNAHVFKVDLQYVEQTTIGCVVGLCAICSQECILARLLLGKINGSFKLEGMSKADLKVQVEDGNIIQISGERTKEEEHGDYMWHRVERHGGKFVRRFRQHDNTDLSNIKCGLENGVSTAVVPKKQTPEPERSIRNIDIA